MIALLALSVAAAATSGAIAAAPLAPVEIVARLDPEIHRIEAQAIVPVETPATAPVVFTIASTLEVSELLRDGEKVAFEVARSETEPRLSRVTVRAAPADPPARKYTLRYAGTIDEPPTVAQFSRDRIADQTNGTIEARGVFLAPESGWYPRASSEPRPHRLEVRLPAGWEAVAEGSQSAREETPQGIRFVFESRPPAEGIHLIAGPWRRFETDHHGIKVAALVYPDDADLAPKYMEAIGRYLDLYSAWLGPYAYDRFAVVENFFSTGYGMAGFTVLGQDVMRLPFIVDTSLGHEVAHGWWGNGVFVAAEGGNWSEGLTTFVADYQYKRQLGPESAADYRREVCRDYTNYVASAGADFALSSFTERTTPATRAVGYGKTMMLFHMLESRIGKEKLNATLQRVFRENTYRAIGWSTWRAAFSKEAGEDLGWFFDQWIDRPGAPALAWDDLSVAADGAGSFVVTGTIVQRSGGWRLDVPVLFEGGGRSERKSIPVTSESTKLRIALPFRPDVARLDPDQDVFRRLAPSEMPPVLSKILGDPDALFVIDDTSGPELTAAYTELAETLTKSGMGKTARASTVTPAELSGRNVFLAGLPATGPVRSLAVSIPGEASFEEGGFRIASTEYRQPGAAILDVGRSQKDLDHAIARFQALSAAAARAAGRKLVHYGKYSWLTFIDGTNAGKGIAKVQDSPLIFHFPSQPPPK